MREVLIVLVVISILLLFSGFVAFMAVLIAIGKRELQDKDYIDYDEDE